MQKFVDYIVKFIHKVLTKFGIGEQMRYSIIRYSFNTGWMFAEKVLFMVVAFFVGVYVARYLGPQKYGLLNYAISFVAIFKVMANLGLNGVLTRELVKSKDFENQLLGTAFLLKLVSSIIGYLIILIALQFLIIDFKNKVLILIIAGSMLFSSIEIARFYFEANVKSKYNAIASSAAIIISSGVKLLMVFTKARLEWFAFAFAIEFVLQAIGIFIFYKKYRPNKRKWKYNISLAKALLRDSWPLLFSGFAAMLYLRIDQLMIKEMINADAVGNYSAAIKISEIWYVIPIVIVSSLFPAIVKEHAVKIKYELRLEQLFSLLVRIAVFIAIPVSIASPFIIGKLFGNDYLDASPVLRIHIWSGIFIFMNNVVARWHIVENKTKIFMIRTAGGAFLNIILNLILIPEYEIIGAAIASLISYFFIAYFSCLLFKPMRKLFVIQSKAMASIIPFRLFIKNKRV